MYRAQRSRVILRRTVVVALPAVVGVSALYNYPEKKETKIRRPTKDVLIEAVPDKLVSAAAIPLHPALKGVLAATADTTFSYPLTQAFKMVQMSIPLKEMRRRGPYTGVSRFWLSYAPAQMLNQPLQNWLTPLVTRLMPKASRENIDIASAALAALPPSLYVTFFEGMDTRRILEGRTGHSLYATFRMQYGAYGQHGILRGAAPTAVREMMWNAMLKAFPAKLRSTMPEQFKGDHPFLAEWAPIAGSALIGAVISQPVQAIITYQQQVTLPESTLKAIRNLASQHGWRAFVRGLLPRYSSYFVGIVVFDKALSGINSVQSKAKELDEARQPRLIC